MWPPRRVVEDCVGGGPCGQGGDLLTRPSLPHAPQQPTHRIRVIDGDLGSGPYGQGGGLFIRTQLCT